MKIYLIAGEASGDVLGSLLMKALRTENPSVTFDGVGGPLMEREGLRSLFPMNDLSVMGIAEVLPRLRLILKRIRETVTHIRRVRPDIVITVDAPDFSFRVVKALLSSPSPFRERAGERASDIDNLARATGPLPEGKGNDFPLLIHYVAPTVWAWRAGRAKKVADLYNGILCLFPFEPPYFQKHGLAAAYVGHPVMEQGYATAGGTKMRFEQHIPIDAPVLGLLFGSRTGEVERHGDTIRAVALALQTDDPALHFLVPTLAHVEGKVRGYLDGLNNVHVVTDPSRKPEAFAAMTAALAVSGTVALELSVVNVPHAILYRMSKTTAAIVKQMIKVKFAHLSNLLLYKEAVPEFIQDDCEPDKILAALRPLLYESHAAEEQQAEFATVRKLLNGKTKDAPSVQAARFVIDLYKLRANGEFKPFAKVE